VTTTALWEARIVGGHQQHTGNRKGGTDIEAE